MDELFTVDEIEKRRQAFIEAEEKAAMDALLARVRELVQGGKRPHLTARISWMRGGRVCRATVNGVTIYETPAPETGTGEAA